VCRALFFSYDFLTRKAYEHKQKIVKPKGAIVNIDEMYFRAPRVRHPCPTGPTPVVDDIYFRNNVSLQPIGE